MLNQISCGSQDFSKNGKQREFKKKLKDNQQVMAGALEIDQLQNSSAISVKFFDALHSFFTGHRTQIPYRFYSTSRMKQY